MELGHWLTVAIFVTTNLITVAGVIISIRVDTSKLKEKMTELAQDMMGMQIELKELGKVLVTLADFKGEINRIQDRQLAQGQRLDETIRQNAEAHKEIWTKIDKLMDDGE